MLHGYENSITGGITRVIQHNAKSNNKYIISYDESKEKFNNLKFINQYREVLSEQISYAGF